jgi:hypothetical protein
MQRPDPFDIAVLQLDFAKSKKLINTNHEILSEVYQELKQLYRDSLVELPDVAELLVKITQTQKNNEEFLKL